MNKAKIEFYDSSRRVGSDMYVSFYASGIVGFSGAIASIFRENKTLNLKVGWAEPKLYFFLDMPEPNLVLSRAGNRYTASATGFLKQFKLEGFIGNRHDAEYDEENKCIIVKLEKKDG